jgi:hypothetical protein
VPYRAAAVLLVFPRRGVMALGGWLPCERWPPSFPAMAELDLRPQHGVAPGRHERRSRRLQCGFLGHAQMHVHDQESVDHVFSPIFGLRKKPAGFRRIWIGEHVGIRRSDDTPTPAIMPEQVLTTFADSGDAMLPGQHACPLERLQRLSNCGAGAPCPLGEGLVFREARARAAVMKAPLEGAKYLEEGELSRAIKGCGNGREMNR